MMQPWMQQCKGGTLPAAGRLPQRSAVSGMAGQPLATSRGSGTHLQQRGDRRLQLLRLG